MHKEVWTAEIKLFLLSSPFKKIIFEKRLYYSKKDVPGEWNCLEIELRNV